MTKPLMELNEQPKAVQQLFGHVGESELYKLEYRETRIRLLFDTLVLGGWADDSNGQHWYVLENNRTLGLNSSFTSILERLRFLRRRQGARHYWLAKGSESTGFFKSAIEEITGVAIPQKVASKGLQASINSLHIRGFRSLADVKLTDIPQVAVMIGANGSGKSNVIRFFDMLSCMLRSSRLQDFVQMQGGADDQLFAGRKRTGLLEAELCLTTERGRNEYRFRLGPAHPDRFVFLEEAFRFSDASFHAEARWHYAGSGHTEAQIVSMAQAKDSTPNESASIIVKVLRNCAGYQFHDTSDDSRFKQNWDVTDNNALRSHGGNLGAVLFRLEREDIDRYRLICRHIGRVLPGFDHFVLEERFGKVQLRWKAKGSDKTYGAHLTSDGSLRFFALVTLLNLPGEMLPDVVLLDEPELGLHPAAIELLAQMVKATSRDRQVILATQSPLLVDAFELEQVIVLDIEDDATRARQLDRSRYENWLEQGYLPGRLWTKNLLGGRP